MSRSTTDLIEMERMAAHSIITVWCVRVRRLRIDKDGMPGLTASFYEPDVKIDEPLVSELNQAKAEV
jgi:hypothetical protein